jgi:uroporphyrinogen III methyltransferase / synthase
MARRAGKEHAALLGRRIVVTRASEKSSAFAGQLRALGAEVVEFPTIAIVEPESFAVLDAAIARLGAFDWLVFTSATGVERFVARMRHLGRDIRALGRSRIAAIGPATAAELRKHALAVDAMPAEYRAEAIAVALGADRIRGARFLIPRAQVAREVLPAMLAELGAAEVVVAPAYRTVAPSGAAVDATREELASRGFDMVAFTSSSTASNFVAMMGTPKPGTVAAAIGPITAETATRLGFDVVVKPSEYTVAALARAIAEYFNARA